MATLIAANYQSQSSTGYGFMYKGDIKLKNNTLYTFKCRYKWNKNSSGSTSPLAGYLFESTWSNHCGASGYFTETHTTYKTMIRTFTTNGNASSYTFAINNYANGQHNSGVADGAILDVDWYELWEGDATTFSLTDAIALSNNKSEDDFLAIQNGCQNTGYFSTAEPINAIRSWIGYYYKTNTYDLTGSLSTTSVSAAANEITINYTIKDIWTNGKKTAKSSATPTVTSTLGTVSNITATNSSGNGTAKLSVPSRGTTVGAARTGTVTISYEGKSITLSFSQAANYMTSISIRTWNASNFTKASGGTIDATTDVTYTSGSSHENWSILTISNWSCSSTGFSIAAQPNYSGQCRITSAGRGTTVGDARSCSLTVSYKNATNTNNVTITATKNIGTQEANAITSYSAITVTSHGSVSGDIPASGGSKTASGGTGTQTITYTSTATRAGTVTCGTYSTVSVDSLGTTEKVRTKIGNSTATLTGEGGKTAVVSVAVYQAANAVTGVKAVVNATSVSSVHFTYSGGTSIPKTGGSIDVTPNGACEFTFTSGATDVKSTGGTYYGKELSFARSYKKDTANTDWLTLNTTSGKITAANNNTDEAREAQITGNLTVTWGSLTHTLAQSRTVKQVAGSIVNGNWQGGAISFSKTSLGAAADSCTVTIQPWYYVWTWNGVAGSGGTTYYTGSVSVSENGTYTSLGSTSYTASSSAKELTLSKSTCGTTEVTATTITVTAKGATTTTKTISQTANTWYDKALQITASPTTIAAAGGTSTVTAKVKRGYTSGSESGWDYGVTATLSGSATGFSISGSTVTATNNTTISERSISVTGKYHNLTSSAITIKQSAGTRTYQIVLDPSSITWAASGGSASVAVKYNTLWNGIKTAGPTTLTGYSVSPSGCTASGTSGTTTITVGQNTTTSPTYPQATFSKSGYTPATLTGTQNKPVTSTETVYRVSSVSPSSVIIGNSSGIGSISVYMDKATRTHYKDTSSGSAFKTTTGTWSRVTGKEAAATNISFYIYFQSVNDSGSVGWIRTGTPTLNLTNGTSTAAAMWYANYANDANTNSTSRQAKMLIVHSTADDVQGVGKNYCIITQPAGQSRIPIQIWGRNENRTDIYVSFGTMSVYVYQHSNTSETHVTDVAFGGGISAGYASERRRLAQNTWYVDRLTYPTITQVTVNFSDVTIDNTLDSSRYRNCEVWAEVCEGDISMEGYSVSGRYKSRNTEMLNTQPGDSWYGQSHTFVFDGSYNNGSYSTGAPLNDNSVVVLFFRFYDY